MEKEKLNIKDKIKIFVKCLDKRKKSSFIHTLRAAEHSNIAAIEAVAVYCNTASSRELNCFAAIGIAFGIWPDGHSDKAGNMGETMKRLSSDMETFENIFRRMLKCKEYEELLEFIPIIVRAAKQKNITINYELLLEDLWYWSEKNHNISAERWAKSFWGNKERSEENVLVENNNQ